MEAPSNRSCWFRRSITTFWRSQAIALSLGASHQEREPIDQRYISFCSARKCFSFLSKIEEKWRIRRGREPVFSRSHCVVTRQSVKQIKYCFNLSGRFKRKKNMKNEKSIDHEIVAEENVPPSLGNISTTTTSTHFPRRILFLGGGWRWRRPGARSCDTVNAPSGGRVNPAQQKQQLTQKGLVLSLSLSSSFFLLLPQSGWSSMTRSDRTAHFSNAKEKKIVERRD